jgi:serine phosphatase RsbU (regulator of sigma subunit)
MNPCYVVRNGELMEIDANRRGIGGIAEVDYQFEGHSMQVEIGDMIYLSSDGYKDQFGGPKGKKFMTSKFKQLLVAVAMQPIDKQYAILDSTFTDWMGEQEQIDDVLVTGYRIT